MNYTVVYNLPDEAYLLKKKSRAPWGVSFDDDSLRKILDRPDAIINRVQYDDVSAIGDGLFIYLS